jgi:hypothetical protein
MDMSSQLVGPIMMALGAGSFVWAYRITSASGFRPRRQERRASLRPQAPDRRNHLNYIDLSQAVSWVRRLAWVAVAAVVLLDLAATFDPVINLT